MFRRYSILYAPLSWACRQPTTRRSNCEQALDRVFGVDTQLIADGTYFVAEAQVDDGRSSPAAEAGANARRSMEVTIAPAAKMLCSILTTMQRRYAPFSCILEWARRGVGSKILEVCEAAAAEAGFRRFEMGATLTGCLSISHGATWKRSTAKCPSVPAYLYLLFIWKNISKRPRAFHQIHRRAHGVRGVLLLLHMCPFCNCLGLRLCALLLKFQSS